MAFVLAAGHEQNQQLQQQGELWQRLTTLNVECHFPVDLMRFTSYAEGIINVEFFLLLLFLLLLLMTYKIGE